MTQLVDFNYVATEIFKPSRGRAVGITRQGLSNLIKRGAFPAPIRMSDSTKGRVRWRLSEIEALLAPKEQQ